MKQARKTSTPAPISSRYQWSFRYCTIPAVLTALVGCSNALSSDSADLKDAGSSSADGQSQSSGTDAGETKQGGTELTGTPTFMAGSTDAAAALAEATGDASVIAEPAPPPSVTTEPDGNDSMMMGDTKPTASPPAASQPTEDASVAKPSAEDASSTLAFNRGFTCSASRSPMFSSDEAIKLTVEANFTQINTAATKADAKSDAMIDPDGDGPLAAVAANISAKGVSRFANCGYRPFKIKFPEKQQGNVFQHLGRSVRISTHCGDREGMHETLHAGSLAEYEERVRMEHAVYQVLDELEMPSLKTRLAEITYEDTSTGTRKTFMGFVREPKDEAAQRCEMLVGKDIPEGTVLKASERSRLLWMLANNFVVQVDVAKNFFRGFDPETETTALFPYDFDLSGIFRREYLGFAGRTLDDNASAFAEWLRRNNSPALRQEVQLIARRAENMRAAYQSAGMNATNEALFDEWFDQFLAAVTAFRHCEDASDEDSGVACYVKDSSADSWQEAEVHPLGNSGTSMLEPPGDVDVLAFDVPAGQLVTFTAAQPATLLDPQGVVLAELGGYSRATSVNLTADAKYYLQLDRGTSLISSDMWLRDPAQDAFVWAAYVDDNHAVEALAEPLLPGVTTGTWEISDASGRVYDEDWFILDTRQITNLTVEFQGEDLALADMQAYRKGGNPDESTGWVSVAPGFTENLMNLFPEQGEYILRAIGSYGGGTYTLTAE